MHSLKDVEDMQDGLRHSRASVNPGFSIQPDAGLDAGVTAWLDGILRESTALTPSALGLA